MYTLNNEAVSAKQTLKHAKREHVRSGPIAKLQRGSLEPEDESGSQRVGADWDGLEADVESCAGGETTAWCC